MDDLRDIAAEEAAAPGEERRMLLVGSDHAYYCKCDTCKEWWRLNGPDPGTGKCGPFTHEEIAEGIA